MRILLLSLSILSLSAVSKDIESTSGIASGYKKNNVINWDDIPYAKPPIGNLRWKAPRKIENSS